MRQPIWLQDLASFPTVDMEKEKPYLYGGEDPVVQDDDDESEDIFARMDNFSLENSAHNSPRSSEASFRIGNFHFPCGPSADRSDSCNKSVKSSGDESEGSGASLGSSSKMAEKTVLCRYFLAGDCSRGDSCSFAHGKTDLRQNDEEEGTNPNKKTKLCRNFFEDGICPFSINCNFAHNLSELKKPNNPPKPNWKTAAKLRKDNRLNTTSAIAPSVFSDSSALLSNSSTANASSSFSTAAASASTSSSTAGDHQKQDDKKLYKTRICKHFFKTGKCWLEDNCRFAHGSEELRKN